MSAATPTAVQAPRHPFIELMARYRAVFQAAWAARAELAGPARAADEIAFLPAAMSLQETPPHPSPRRAAIVIVALFAIALIWACVGQVDIVAVAHGKVVVSERTKLIQPLETSVVKAIHVRDGDKVRAGQLLVELDATAPDADTKRLGQERSTALSESLRTQALAASLASNQTPKLIQLTKAHEHELSEADLISAQAQLQSEWADISAKQAKLNAEVKHREAEIATVREQINKLQTTLPIVKQRE